MIGPYEMEHEYGLIGGNIFHGELSAEQLFHMRPAAGIRRLPLSDRGSLPGELCHPRGWRCVWDPRLSSGAGDLQRPQQEGAPVRPEPVTAVARARLQPRAPSAALAAMLEASSVAVVGASPRPGSFGREMLLELQRGGYDGDIFPVNPRYGAIDDLHCHPSLEAIGGPVDAVLLGVPNALLEAQMEAAAASGAAGAVIFASCYEEPRPGVPPLTERIAAIARTAGMSICGGNCMGFLNVERGLRACGFSMPMLEPGGVTFITHSGSAFAALAHNDRNLRFNLVVSAGQELVTSTTDYLRYALGLESTRVVALFLETVRDPADFQEVLALAAERDIPVVALKVGRQERAKRLVEAHSGALAGSDAAFEALFDAYGVARVATLDELADTAELFASGRRAGPGALAAIHDSGGERALLVDIAADVGVEFATLAPPTIERLEGVLEQGLTATNPLDAWGTGNDAEQIFRQCMDALLDDPATAALAFCVDMTTESDGIGSYVQTALDVYPKTAKPMAMLGNLASAIDRADSGRLRDGGVPVLEGTVTGLAAFRHLFAYRDFRARSRPPATAIDVALFAAVARATYRGRGVVADRGAGAPCRLWSRRRCRARRPASRRPSLQPT